LDHSFQLQRLRDQVGSLAPVPTSRHGATPSSVPATLQQAKFVFVRRDAHRTPLQRPYEGPFRVIESGPKTFKIDMGGKTETISVNRLKLAHLDVDCPVQLAQPRPRGRPPGKTQRPSTSHVPQRAIAHRKASKSSETFYGTPTSRSTTPSTHQSGTSSSSE
jgi:cleavage and polyadenylation specificity factor subunit 1